MARSEKILKKRKVLRKDSAEDTMDSYTVLVRSVQRDRLVKNVLEDTAKIKLGVKSLDAELQNYILKSIDLETGGPLYHGVNPRLENPRKDLRQVSKMLLDIQAFRDRITKIRGDLNAKASKLTRYKRSMFKYIRAQYRKTVESQGSIKNQDAFIDSVLWELIEKRTTLEDQIARVEIIAKNLDNAWFTYNALITLGRDLMSGMEARGGRD